MEDARQGGDPRLLLELALVKVTRPGSDLSLESMAFRLEQLELGRRAAGGSPAADPPSGELAAAAPSAAGPAQEPPGGEPPRGEPADAEPPSLALAQLQDAWRRTVMPALERRSIPASAMLREARPAGLDGDTLTLEFPRAAAFHRERAEEPKTASLLLDALFEVTGRHMQLVFATGEPSDEHAAGPERPVTEEEIVELVKSTFDAQELEI